jgi:hypothetical protein
MHRRAPRHARSRESHNDRAPSRRDLDPFVWQEQNAGFDFAEMALLNRGQSGQFFALLAVPPAGTHLHSQYSPIHTQNHHGGSVRGHDVAGAAVVMILAEAIAEIRRCLSQSLRHPPDALIFTPTT